MLLFGINPLRLVPQNYDMEVYNFFLIPIVENKTTTSSYVFLDGNFVNSQHCNCDMPSTLGNCWQICLQLSKLLRRKIGLGKNFHCN
jgi:hypothetical protein